MFWFRAPEPLAGQQRFHQMKAAKIVDFETSFDAAPVATAEGEMIWAEVRILYTASGLNPAVSIRVPVAWRADETHEQRKSAVLRAARDLIDHACRASGLSPPEASVSAMIEDVLPPTLAGLTQELGLAPPAARPKRKMPSR